jgi:hypothetical protein
MLASLLPARWLRQHGWRRRSPVDVKGADVSKRTMDNGDTIEEYRVSGQLRMVKVTPSRGAPFYMYDKNGDGRMDNDKDGVSPVWRLYSW